MQVHLSVSDEQFDGCRICGARRSGERRTTSRRQQDLRLHRRASALMFDLLAGQTESWADRVISEPPLRRADIHPDHHMSSGYGDFGPQTGSPAFWATFGLLLLDRACRIGSQCVFNDYVKGGGKELWATLALVGSARSWMAMMNRQITDAPTGLPATPLLGQLTRLRSFWLVRL